MSSRADIAGMGSKTTTRSGDAAILTGNKTAVIHYPDQVTTHTTKTAVPAGANISSAANGPNLSVVSYSTLFRNADALDWVLISIGTIAALGNGFGFPAFTILFGKFLDKFGSPDGGMKESISMLSVYFIILGAATFAASYLEVTMWTLAAHRQTQRIRGLYLQAVLRQDITFFDTQGSTGGLLMGLNEDCNAIQAGIGEKVGNLLHHMTTFAGGYAVAFCRGWDMTLLMLGAMPLLAAVGAAMATMTSNMEKVVVTSYAQANGIVQQATSQVRTVAAYGGEERVLAEYAAALVLPFKSGSRQSVVSGAGMGAMQLMSFSTFAGAMYYGAWRVSEGDYTGGQVLNVLLAALLGGMSLGMGMPNLPYLAKACTAGARIFNVISRKPNIVDDPKGEAPKQVHGALEMRGVSFAYPTRPELLVFRDLSLTVPAGKTVALVGPSGSGKSTVVQLLQRFYDPAAGQVLLDGTDIRNLRLSWLRSQMGLVSQEPTLFATDIYENIAMGREGATREQVEDAARAANAHSFISALPEGYSTQVGERGVQLSGGQKQRVAIARAILKNPRIMLLDEATSALDTASERLVQAALDKLVVGRTTVVVAHRLSTIRGAHAIAVIQEGRVVELGSHDELIEKPGGAYKMLVKIQMQAGQLEVAPGAPQEDDTDRPGGWMATSVSPNSDSDKNGTQLEKRGSREVQLVVHKQDAKEVAAQEAMALEEAKVPLSRLAALNLPEWWLAALGSLAALVAGGAMTASGLVFASMTTILYLPSPSRVLHEARFYALMFFVIAVAMFISLLVLHSCFGTMGQQLARRVRLMLLKSVIYQEVGWFDLPSHTSGELVARLSEDSIAIRGAVGDTLAVMLQNIAALVVGYAIAFYYDWRMTLLVTGIFPLLVAAQILQMKSALSQGSSGLDNSFTANQTITDAFSSIRVVQSYNLQGYINKLYDRLLAPSMAAAKKQAHIAGIAMGFTWLVNFGMYSLVVWFGGWEVRHNLSTFDDFFRAFFCVLLAGVAMGQSQAGMTDVGAAQKAVQRVFPLLDRKSRINAADPGGRAADSVAGELTLRDVTFAYPARPIVMVFNRFSLHMPAGKQVALVGESGSGKSTVVGLVQRFYDPQEGVVLLDGVDVRQYNLRWLRSQMGLVSQEPLLFSCSILENIRYGRPDATVEQVEAAARAANAWDFIMAQPDGLNTAVGERGVQLSGGQKQRVAIARAVVRDPRILLLDEATSALDAESEHLVQEALDRIMPGRTTVTVAHRLSTIRNAHMIAVVYRGAVLEQGTHEELMNKEGGAYARLVAAQMKA